MSRLFATAAAVFTLFAAGCDEWGAWDRVEESFRFDYPVQTRDRLSVESRNGSVEILGWEEDRVEVAGEKYARDRDRLDQIRIDVRQTAGRLDVRTIFPSGRGWGSGGARYRIRVPRRMVIDRVETSNGPLRLENVESSARLMTSNGPVRIINVEGDMDVRTSNGPIELTRFRGAVDLTSSNGPIRAEGVHGHGGARTSNGPIELEITGLEGVRGVRAETSNAPIRVELPADAGARIEASTSNAQITTDHTISPPPSPRDRSIEGIIGAGGPLIELRTSNAPIRLASN
jgi:DUF4097 and DUF4098 domain-containing protein YvlB